MFLCSWGMYVDFQGLCCNGKMSFLTEISWRTQRVSRGAGTWKTCLGNCEHLYSFWVEEIRISINRKLLVPFFYCRIKISCYWRVSLIPKFCACSIEIEFDQYTPWIWNILHFSLGSNELPLFWMKTLSDWYIWIDIHTYG